MYRINFQQIYYFLTVAEVLNFTEAAKILYISQPALSKQISILENELDFHLFVRDKRHVSLTPEGVSLYKDWKELDKLMDSSIYNAKIIGKQTTGKLSLGCTDTFQTEDILTSLLQEFRSSYSKIDIDIESHSFKTLRENLMNETMDVIFTPYFELEDLPDVDWIKIKDVSLGIVVPAQNPLSQKEELNICDLKEETFLLISPKDSPGGMERTISLCRKYGFLPKQIKYVPNVTSLVLAIRNGLGVAICDTNTVPSNHQAFKVYHTKGLPTDSFLIAVWKKHRKSIALDLFKSMLITRFEDNKK